MNFGNLDDLIHNDAKKIVLETDIVLDDDEASEYLEGIELDVNGIIIDGNGHTIDACGKARIFKCRGKNITLKNITFKNGCGDENGGAICNEGELSISKSSFMNNHAREGGAIYNGKGMLIITESELNENNSVIGGAISNYARMRIVESSLNRNTSQVGGAIYNFGKLCIEKSVFDENTSEKQGHGGGAIHNNASLTITESKFTSNRANSFGGGAIYNEGGNINIIRSTFCKNLSKELGGAILNISGNLVVSESQLNANSSELKGGAIFIDKGKLDITSSSIIGNSSSDGGAVYNNEGILTIMESTLSGNSSDADGVIYNKEYSASTTITKSIINKNRSNRDGGAIYVGKGNFKITKCQIFANSASDNIISNYDSLQIFNSSFNNNKGKNIIRNLMDESNLSILNGEFMDNDVADSVVFNSGKFCIIEKCIFDKNNFSENVTNYSYLTLKNPKINDEGQTILNEGQIIIKDKSPNLTNKIHGEGKIKKIIIPLEKKFDFGYLDKKIHESTTKKIILEEDIFLEDYENEFYEGGIELDIDNLVIDGNGKTIDGANKSRIFIITGSNITLKNLIFKNGHSHKSYDNLLNNNGGALKINHDTNLTIYNCKFTNNTSEADGGAIYNSGELNITESILYENIINEKGGAVYNDNDAILTITKSILNQNKSKEYGGALYNSRYNAELTIKKSIINENSTKQKDYSIDGAINNNGKLTISESTINENVGHAIINDGKLSIMGSTINENTRGAIETWADELSLKRTILYKNSGLIDFVGRNKKHIHKNHCIFKDNNS